MAQGDDWGWWNRPERDDGSGAGRAAGQDAYPKGGSVYRSAAATGDPDATLVMPSVMGDQGWTPSGVSGGYARPDTPRPPEEQPSGGQPSEGQDEPDEHEGGSAAKNSAIMAVGSLVSRLTGFLRTAVIAAALGSNLVGDAYTTAQFFPGMIYELLLGGILGDFIIPVLVRARKNSPDRGQAFTQRLLTLAAISLGTATLLAVLAAPLLGTIFSQGATDAKRHVITVLSYLILPTIFFYGMSAVFGSVLYSRNHFAAPMWAPILNNLVVIGTGGLYLALFGTKPVTPEQMTPARLLVIGGGTLLGIVVQSLGLWPALRRVGFRWRWRFDFRQLGLRELGRLSGWMFLYVGIGQLGILILLYLLNRANKSGNHAGTLIYNNVYLLLMMAHGIVAVSIITALLPRMSAAAADGRLRDVAADLSRGTRTSVAMLAPIAVCYVVLAQPAMITLFERGAFTRSNAIASSGVLVIAGLALIPYALSQLLTFAFYAQANTRTPAMISIPVTGLRVVLQVAVFMLFAASFTATGLMVGNAVSYLLAVTLSVMVLRRSVGRLGISQIAITLFKVGVAAAGAAGAGWIVIKMLPGGADGTWNQAAIQLVAGGIAVCLTYLALSVVLRIPEVKEVLGLIRRRLPGGR